jgi:D-alanyl-D-alanine carboxypeptidase
MNHIGKPFLCSLLMALLLMVSSCSIGQPPRSAEELRLERISRIDTAALFAVLNPDTLEGADQLEALTAEAWILVDDSFGILLSSRNADQRMFPASLTKMMTCLLTLERGNLGDTLEITQDVFVTRDSRVRPGDSYEVGNLLREMMLQSDNVAAYALGKYIGGDTLAFCDLMNQKAAYLGMDSTHFANPNGMPNDSNYTTARDLLALTRYCLSDSLFSQIVATPSMDIPLTDGRHLRCDNTNLLLGNYEGCVGVKTGYTRQAGSCLASAATRDGTTLVLILLKSRTRASRFTESAVLLDYGFRLMAAYRAAQ